MKAIPLSQTLILNRIKNRADANAKAINALRRPCGGCDERHPFYYFHADGTCWDQSIPKGKWGKGRDYLQAKPGRERRLPSESIETLESEIEHYNRTGTISPKSRDRDTATPYGQEQPPLRYMRSPNPEPGAIQQSRLLVRCSTVSSADPHRSKMADLLSIPHKAKGKAISPDETDRRAESQLAIENRCCPRCGGALSAAGGRCKRCRWGQSVTNQ